jgi:uncharacterized membrane protein (UPF0182 family)
LRAEQGQLPELKRVIAAYGDQVVMKETLGEALAALFKEEAPETSGAAAETSEASTAEWVREALGHYNQAIEHMKSGDWTGFGRELDAMRAVLENAGRQSSKH